ncbi:hypothetical protein [Paenibacillus sp. GCM10027626]|uniref:hypothetical protein n=1 Tax=Paenibacillus sp. GCM10027626 TaxID=3273411 RepID=UPI003642EDF8
MSAGVFAPAIRGFYKGLGGGDGTWKIREQASVIYKLDSVNDAFLSLEGDIAVRAGVFGSKVSIYAGDSPDHATQLVAELTEGGGRKLDLTPYAQESKTVYVKLVIAETAFDWGGILSVKFSELTTS